MKWAASFNLRDHLSDQSIGALSGRNVVLLNWTTSGSIDEACCNAALLQLCFAVSSPGSGDTR